MNESLKKIVDRMMRINASRLGELRERRGLPSSAENAEYYGRLKEQENLNKIFQDIDFQFRPPHTATEAMSRHSLLFHYFGSAKELEEFQNLKESTSTLMRKQSDMIFDMMIDGARSFPAPPLRRRGQIDMSEADAAFLRSMNIKGEIWW